MGLVMSREQGLEALERTRIIAIVRGVAEEHIVPVAEALFQGGIRVMEITLNTPGALSMISLLQDQFGQRMYIGAGTILDVEDAQRAFDAGASFFVMPNTDPQVIRYAAERHLPAFPGAMTPTEVVAAWKAGATAVKIFPTASLGFPYIRELKAPLDHIPIMAVGGVNEENIAEYLGICYAAGIGGSLINLQQIEASQYSWITDKAARLLARVPK